MDCSNNSLFNFQNFTIKTDHFPEAPNILGLSPKEIKTHHEVISALDFEGLTNSQLEHIREKIPGTLSKITRDTHWIEFKNKLMNLERNISCYIFQISFYQTFEHHCGLAGISPSRYLDNFHQLIQSFEEITRIYDELYQHNKDQARADLKLAKIEFLQAALKRILVALMEHRQTLVELLKNPTSADRKTLEKVKSFIIQERLVVERILQRLSSFNLPGHPCDAVPENLGASNAWISGIFQTLRHPLRALQKAFDAIERMSPLPSYSAPVLLAEKEGGIANDFVLLVNFLEDHQSTLEEALETIFQSFVNATRSAKESRTMEYQRWLDEFSHVLQEGQTTITRLEALESPNEKEFDQANEALKAIEFKKKTLNSMEKRLIKHGFCVDVLNRLHATIDKCCVEISDLIELLHYRSQVNVLSEKGEDLAIILSDQALELSRGINSFSVDGDAALLENLQAFEKLYQKVYQSDLPKRYKHEISKKIAEEVSSIAFIRSEYSTDFQQGLEAEVAAVSLLPPDSAKAKRKTKALLDKIRATEEIYLQHDDNVPYSLRERLAKLQYDDDDDQVFVLKEFNKVHEQLKGDLSFIREQIKILEHKKEISTLRAWWRVRSHAKAVERHVKVINEGLNKNEETWGDTLIRFWLYSLYHHERISSVVQFASHLCQSWKTGLSPLKSYADILSDTEFAKNVGELPEEEQAKTAVELKLIEGILSGYIDYPADLKKNHPTAALFLFKKFNISPPTDPLLESEKGAFEQVNVHGGPYRRDLSDAERHKMVVQYIGARVRGHYKKIERRLEGPYMKMAEADWTTHFNHPPDEDPKSENHSNPMEHFFGQQLVDAIKDNQKGIPSDQNNHLLELQKNVKAAFGTSLPSEWIEECLFKQAWTEERLTHFAGWLSGSIGAQASYFLAQQRASYAKDSGTLMTTPPLLTASIGQQEVKSSIHTVQALLPSKKQIEELFNSPLQTSTAARFDNPLSSIFKIIQQIRSGIVNALWETERPGLDKNKTTLDPIHQEVLSQLEKNRSLSQLKTLIESPEQLIDDSLFQHILGTYFGKKTGLEGYNVAHIYDYLLQLTHSKIQALKENPLCDEFSRLEFCRIMLEREEEELPIQLFSAIATQIEQAKELDVAFRDSLERFYKSFESKTNTLNSGESFFFSGGWTAYGIGHHVVYEVLKQPDGLLTFRVYNRGDGAEFHANALVQAKNLLLPFTEIVDIEPARMISIPFLKSLQDLKLKSLQNKHPLIEKEKWEAKHLYAEILPILGGKDSSRVYSSDYLMEAQLVGHCSYLSITPWMRHHLGNQQTYSRWQFEVELKTLVDYFKQKQHLLPFHEQARHLLREGLSQFGRNIDQAYRDGLITDDEMTWLQELIKGINNAAAKAEAIYQESINANSEKVEIEPVKHKLSVSVNTKNVWKDIDAYKSPLPPPYFAIDPQSWQYVPQNFSKDLNLFLNDIREARKARQDLNIKEAVQTLIEKVPLTGNVFWEKMTAGQAKEALSQLAALCRHYLFSLEIIRHNNPMRDALDLENYLVVAKYLTLADAIMRHFKEEFGFKIPFLPQNEMLDILSGRSVFTNTIHVKWADELRKLNQYWNEVARIEPRKPDQLSFFGFEEPHAEVGDKKSYRRGIWENPKDFNITNNVNVWGANFAWLDVAFAIKWLERPEVAEQFAKDFPQYEQAEPVFKAMIALGNSSKFKRTSDLLPTQFFDLRDIAYSAAFLLQGPSLNEYFWRIWKIRDTDFEPKISLHVTRSFEEVKGQDKPCWFFDYSPFGLPIDGDGYEYSDSIRRNFPLPEYRDPASKLQKAQEIVGNNFDSFILGEKDIPFSSEFRSRPQEVRRRIDPHKRNFLNFVTRKKSYLHDIDSWRITSSLNWADTQKHLRLSSVEELQVLEVLSLYYKEPYLLLNHDERALFHFLINEKGLFIDELLRSPEHAALRTQQLAKFIYDQYHTYEKLGTVHMQLYFLELNGQFQSLMQHVRQHYPACFPQGYKEPFMETRALLKTIMENEAYSENDRIYAAFQLVKTFSSHEDLTTDDAVDLLHAGIWVHQNVPSLSTNQIDLQWSGPQIVESWDLLRKMRGPLERALLGDKKNKILNGLLKKYNPQAPDMRWEVNGHFPCFIADDGCTTIDVIEGNFLLKTKSKIMHVEKFVAGLPIFKEGAPVGSNKYEFTDGEGNNYRLLKKFNGVILQGRFKGNWYQLVEQEHVPYTFIRKKNINLWLSNQENECFCKDSETDQYLYRLEIEKDSNGESFITTVHRTNAEGIDTSEVLVDIYSQSTPYDFLKRIEDIEYVAVWQDKVTHEPIRIELPRYNLEFEMISVGNEKRVYCKQLPGYFLAPKQHIKTLGDVTSYLVLQKEQKKGTFKQIVLMPCEQMQSIIKNPLETETAPEHKTNRFVVHDINPISQRLKPRNGEGRFLLAMVYLWERKYAEALDYLREYGSQLAPLSQNEKEVLSWIQDIEKLNHDNTPQAKAVLMYSHYLKLRNHLDFEKGGFDQTSFFYLTALAKDYNDYAMVLEQIGHTQLKPEEELLILRSLPPTTLSPYARHRWNVISPQEFMTRFPLLSLASTCFTDGFENYKEKALLDSVWWDIRLETIVSQLKKSSRAPEFWQRSSLSDNFMAAYEQLKSRNYKKILPLLIEDISGMAPPSHLPIETLKVQLLQMLWLIYIGFGTSTSESERVAALILGMVLEDPYNGYVDAEGFFHPPNDLLKEPDKIALRNWRPSFIHRRSQIAETIQQDSLALLNTEATNHQNDVIVPAEFKSSLLQKEIEFFPKPIVDHVDRYVSTKKPTQEKIEQTRLTSQSLQNLFDIKTGDLVADRAFGELKKQIKNFGDSLGGMKEQYEIKNIQSIQDLKVQLRQKNEDLSLALLFQGEEMLKLANRPFTDPLEEAKRQAKINGGLETLIEFPELLQLFRMRNREKFYRRNPALSVKEIDQLTRQIRDFLIVSILRQQRRRVIDKIDEIEKGMISKLSEQELNGLVGEFVEMASAVRQYDINEHPEYLNLEYHGEILIRGSQAVNQKRIESYKPRAGSHQKNGAAVEIIPGEGKTSVHLTLQVLNDADGERLPLVVMPESLMPQMSKEIQERLGDAYEKVVEMMSFDRADVFDVPRLERIKYRLESIIKDQKVLLMTDSSVQSLVLKFVEKIVTFVDRVDPSVLKEIGFFRQILAILRTSGIVTIDEIHLILDVLKAHHFTLGESLPIKKEVLETTTDFYLLLATHPLIRKKINFSFLADQGGKPFDAAYYQKEVQPILVQAILDGAVGKQDKETRDFFDNLNDRQKNLVRAYLNNFINKEASEFVDKLPSMKIKNTLAILKEEISLLLPLTGKKQLDVHYGALPPNENAMRSDPLLAIPYHGSNNPVINAQFGTELEIIHYTIQMYLEKGISTEIILQELEHLKTNIRDELSKGAIKTIEESLSYKSYKRLCGQSQPPPIFILNDRDISEITKSVNRDVTIQMELIKRYILPQLKNFSQQLHTSGQIYAALFMMVRGFSGSIWNGDSFAKIFHEIFLSDTMARTLNILWENSPQKVETVCFPTKKEFNSPQDKAEALVDAIYAKREGFIGSFADAAGLFREIDNNENVARAILTYQKQPIEGVAYYNNENKLFVLVKEQNKGVPIDQCGLSKEQIVAYWDQKHTYGANIILGGLMKATISVGQFTMAYDLIQAVWRLRQLDRGQRVDFIVSEEDEKIIRNTLKRITNKEIEGRLELKDLVLYTMYNQAMRQGDDNHRSLKQKMQMLLICKLFEIVIDASVSDEDLVNIMEKTKELFISNASPNPYEQYGKQAEYDERDIVLKQELEQFKNSTAMKVFAEHPVLSKRFSIKQIESELHSIVDAERSKLPGQLMKVERYETELAVQLEAERKTETKTESETETQVEQRLELYGDEWDTSKEDPFPEIVWGRETFYEKGLFTPCEYAKISQKFLPDLQNAADFLDDDDEIEIPQIKRPAYAKYTQRSLPRKAADFLGDGISPVVRFKDVVEQEEMTKEYADLIDSGLSATINLMPVYKREYAGEYSVPVFRPFGRFHEQTPYVIIVEDKDTGTRQFILADQVDAKQFRKILDEDRRNPYNGKEVNIPVRLCLYHLGLGIDAQGSDPIDIAKLEKDPQIIKLKAQAKFLAGYLAYTEEEQETIREWIKAKGAERLYAFFYHIVLNNNPTQQKAFPGSQLGNIFLENGIKF